MKILFLDMDGVLCTDRSHKAYAEPRQFMMLKLDPVAVRLLYKSLQQTGAELVLSSTWRVSFNRPAMTAILMQSGFEAEPPWHKDWCTPLWSRMSGTRGKEIQDWMQSNGTPEKYAIIDDNEDFLLEQKDHVVLTDFSDGLLWRHYEQICKLLT